MNNIDNPKVETFTPQVFIELFPEIININYDLLTLRATLSFNNKEKSAIVYVIFIHVRGFRVLDEGDLLEFWGADVRVPGWFWKVNSGGWSDLEKTKGGFTQGYLDIEYRQEYLLLGINDCVSVITDSEPEIVVID